jgi:carbon storage regulator
MLVLSRKQGERIMVGDCLEVTVVEIRGSKVRLGFRAPEHVAIHRQEIYERISSTITNVGSTTEATT